MAKPSTNVTTEKRGMPTSKEGLFRGSPCGPAWTASPPNAPIVRKGNRCLTATTQHARKKTTKTTICRPFADGRRPH